MKVCDYCGRENEHDVLRCRECGTDEFKKPGGQPPEGQGGGAVEVPESELEAFDIATTCDWCGRKNVAGADNCPECGTSLRRPKAKTHIEPQIAQPLVRWKFKTLTPDEMKMDLVTLLTCQNIVEADVVLAQLESIGISAFIPDEFVAQTMAWNINGFGYVRVQVAPRDYERAKAFLLELSDSAEPGAAPNGGPTTPSRNLGAREGPPSES
jgi:ribosomal protein L40E